MFINHISGNLSVFLFLFLFWRCYVDIFSVAVIPLKITFLVFIDHTVNLNFQVSSRPRNTARTSVQLPSADLETLTDRNNVSTTAISVSDRRVVFQDEVIGDSFSTFGRLSEASMLNHQYLQPPFSQNRPSQSTDVSYIRSGSRVFEPLCLFAKSLS